MKDYQSLSHTKWDCKYHVVFIPKYRRKKIFGTVRQQLREIFHGLAKQKESRIVEGHRSRAAIHSVPGSGRGAVGAAEHAVGESAALRRLLTLPL